MSLPVSVEGGVLFFSFCKSLSHKYILNYIFCCSGLHFVADQAIGECRKRISVIIRLCALRSIVNQLMHTFYTVVQWQRVEFLLIRVLCDGFGHYDLVETNYCAVKVITDQIRTLHIVCIAW